MIFACRFSSAEKFCPHKVVVAHVTFDIFQTGEVFCRALLYLAFAAVDAVSQNVCRQFVHIQSWRVPRGMYGRTRLPSRAVKRNGLGALRLFRGGVTVEYRALCLGHLNVACRPHLCGKYGGKGLCLVALAQLFKPQRAAFGKVQRPYDDCSAVGNAQPFVQRGNGLTVAVEKYNPSALYSVFLPRQSIPRKVDCSLSAVNA